MNFFSANKIHIKSWARNLDSILCSMLRFQNLFSLHSDVEQNKIHKTPTRKKNLEKKIKMFQSFQNENFKMRFCLAEVKQSWESGNQGNLSLGPASYLGSLTSTQLRTLKFLELLNFRPFSWQLLLKLQLLDTLAMFRLVWT